MPIIDLETRNSPWYGIDTGRIDLREEENGMPREPRQVVATDLGFDFLQIQSGESVVMVTELSRLGERDQNSASCWILNRPFYAYVSRLLSSGDSSFSIRAVGRREEIIPATATHPWHGARSLEIRGRFRVMPLADLGRLYEEYLMRVRPGLIPGLMTEIDRTMVPDEEEKVAKKKPNLERTWHFGGMYKDTSSEERRVEFSYLDYEVTGFPGGSRVRFYLVDYRRNPIQSGNLFTLNGDTFSSYREVTNGFLELYEGINLLTPFRVDGNGRLDVNG